MYKTVEILIQVEYIWYYIFSDYILACIFEINFKISIEIWSSLSYQNYSNLLITFIPVNIIFKRLHIMSSENLSGP